LARTVGENLFVFDKGLPGKAQIAGMRSGVHANRVAGAGLDTHAAINAAQRIDFVADRVFLDRIARIFSGLDVNTVGRAGGRAKKTGRAVGGVIRAESQTVPAAKGVRIKSSFFGIL